MLHYTKCTWRLKDFIYQVYPNNNKHIIFIIWLNILGLKGKCQRSFLQISKANIDFISFRESVFKHKQVDIKNLYIYLLSTKNLHKKINMQLRLRIM